MFRMQDKKNYIVYLLNTGAKKSFITKDDLPHNAEITKVNSNTNFADFTGRTFISFMSIMKAHPMHHHCLAWTTL